MKIIKRIMVFVAAGALLAGCATNRNTGGLGNETEIGGGAGSDVPPATSEFPMGPNGSVGPGNPFGLGPGTGLDRVHDY